MDAGWRWRRVRRDVWNSRRWAGGEAVSAPNRCDFCGNPSTLLCDGRIYEGNGVTLRVPLGWPNGKTRSCDAHVCRACAKKVGDVHINGRGGCRWDTRDLCPDCQQAQETPVKI